jgi:hypothetical protein
VPSYPLVGAKGPYPIISYRDAAKMFLLAKRRKRPENHFMSVYEGIISGVAGLFLISASIISRIRGLYHLISTRRERGSWGFPVIQYPNIRPLIFGPRAWKYAISEYRPAIYKSIAIIICPFSSSFIL